ncbi:MAG TPA: beta-ketoacyl-ACP synthase II [Gaiellaceae bacterium]|jgi:3-oxoacyl-[acyl-carrier-protein] synthase II|nr:beta-ketoacyl-ACP synthase II [Gaiellaceae bacterium]
MRRVVVTGLGAVTPIGSDAPSTWRAAVAGESGIDFIRSFDPSEFPVRVAAEVKDFDPTQVAPPKDARRLDRNVLLSLGAAREAVADARLDGAYSPDRVGILFGTAIGGIMGIVEQVDVLRDRGPGRVAPTFIPNVLVDTASGQLSIALGFRGPNYAPVSACATGSTAVGEAAELIKRGGADAVLAGGAEACITPLILAGFCAMRGLAAEEDHPPRASRPFDATRAGFVMGEGACVLVLEELEAAERRGATVYAEILGYGMSNDGHHLAQPDPESVGVVAMMRQALERANVEPAQVGYVNAHGTSTPLGDAAETRAIKEVFGDHAYQLAVSSTKSVTGHCFGAAGAVEAMMCVLAVRDGILPPTMNYEHPDPACDLDYVPNEARQAQVEVALSNAMGLGGHNGCVLVGRV